MQNNCLTCSGSARSRKHILHFLLLSKFVPGSWLIMFFSSLHYLKKWQIYTIIEKSLELCIFFSFQMVLMACMCTHEINSKINISNQNHHSQIQPWPRDLQLSETNHNPPKIDKKPQQKMSTSSISISTKDTILNFAILTKGQ